MNYYYLSIDFGESYVGLAVSNGLLATPLEVFKYSQGKYLLLRNHLIEIIHKNNISYIVIGIPFSNELSSLRIKKIFLSSIFIENELKEKIIWVNEDYSTKEAILLKKRKRMREDSIAASIILENYLLESKKI